MKLAHASIADRNAALAVTTLDAQQDADLAKIGDMEEFATTLCVPHMGAAVQPDRHGIGCAGVYFRRGQVGLVLIADGQQHNPGASATNAAVDVLNHLVRTTRDGFQFQECLFVERDSTGSFDYIQPLWDQRGRVADVGFAPLLHGAAQPRSEGAFVQRFGPVAWQLLAVLARTGPY